MVDRCPILPFFIAVLLRNLGIAVEVGCRDASPLEAGVEVTIVAEDPLNINCHLRILIRHLINLILLS